MDNQQQQQTNILPQKTVGELIGLAAGLGIVGLGLLWGVRQVIPEWQPSGR